MIPDLSNLQLDKNPAQMCYDRCVADWQSLTPEQQAFEKIASGAIYRRYTVSQKYGPQTYNYLSAGGTQDPFKE